MPLVWKGQDVIEAVRRAGIEAVNQTMSDAVVHAKRNHTWKDRSTDLGRSIQIVRPAYRQGSQTIGVWGSTDLDYALIHELGGTIVPKRAKFLTIPVTENARRAGSPRKMSGLRYAKTKGGQPVLVDQSGQVQYLLRKSVRIPARPYLRPAADEAYPRLIKHYRYFLKRAFAGQLPPASVMEAARAASD